MSQSNYLHVMFKGYVNDDDDDDELEFAEFDTKAYSMQDDIDKIEPNRDPKLETEFLGNNKDFELKFKFKVTWMDRDADIDIYLDKVQSELENGLNANITDREKLGYTKD